MWEGQAVLHSNISGLCRPKCTALQLGCRTSTTLQAQGATLLSPSSALLPCHLQSPAVISCPTSAVGGCPYAGTN